MFYSIWKILMSWQRLGRGCNDNGGMGTGGRDWWTIVTIYNATTVDSGGGNGSVGGQRCQWQPMVVVGDGYCGGYENDGQDIKEEVVVADVVKVKVMVGGGGNGKQLMLVVEEVVVVEVDNDGWWLSSAADGGDRGGD